MNIDSTETQLPPIPCPELATWESYLQGEIEESFGQALDAHLEQCPDCNRKLEQVETSRVAELAPTGTLADEQIVANVVNAAKSGRLRWGETKVLGSLAAEDSKAKGSIGPYRLLEPIANGGMGRVFLAEHARLKKKVALKLLPLNHANQGTIQRFEREIEAIGKLSHGAIVQATDAGTDAGYLYLAMEYIDGWDLSKTLRSSRTMAVCEVCEIGRQVALALSYAHHQGMVHRDIKPSNIMLDRQGNVKLLDFGLVLLDRWNSPLGELTTVGQFLGTLDYMAPEQAAKSGSVDHRSDLYSLGATLFRLLTGELPLAMHPHQSPLEKLQALHDHQPVRISTLRKDLPNELCRVIDSLLATQPNKRPASAALVAEMLESLAKGGDLQQLANDLSQSTLSPSLLPLSEPLEPIQPILQSSKFRWRWIPLWIATACLPFAGYFGFTLILEDPSGNLVIESELSDLEVKIARTDGTSAKEWQIEQGSSLTKLKAGSYTIAIPSDSVVVTPDLVTLSKGETVIAKVTKKTAEAPVVEETRRAPVPRQRNSVQSTDPKIRTLVESLTEEEWKAFEKHYGDREYLEVGLTMLKTLDDFVPWYNLVSILSQEVLPNNELLAEVVTQQFREKKSRWKQSWISMLFILPPKEIDKELVKDLTAPGSPGTQACDEFLLNLANLSSLAGGRAKGGSSSHELAKQLPRSWRALDSHLKRGYEAGHVPPLPKLLAPSAPDDQYSSRNQILPAMGRILKGDPRTFLKEYPYVAFAFLEARTRWGASPVSPEELEDWRRVATSISNTAYQQYNWSLFFGATQYYKQAFPGSEFDEAYWQAILPKLEELMLQAVEKDAPFQFGYANYDPRFAETIGGGWDINGLPPMAEGGTTERTTSQVPVFECGLRMIELLPVSHRPVELLQRLKGSLVAKLERLGESGGEDLIVKGPYGGPFYWKLNPDKKEVELVERKTLNSEELIPRDRDFATRFSTKMAIRKIEFLMAEGSSSIPTFSVVASHMRNYPSETTRTGIGIAGKTREEKMQFHFSATVIEDKSEFVRNNRVLGMIRDIESCVERNRRLNGVPSITPRRSLNGVPGFTPHLSLLRFDRGTVYMTYGDSAKYDTEEALENSSFPRMRLVWEENRWKITSVEIPEK